MQNLIFTLHVVAPDFLIVLLGLILRLWNKIDDSFAQATTSLVFSVCLPALVFLSLYSVDLGTLLNLRLILFGYFGYFFCFGLSWLVAYKIEKNTNRGAFIQGAFRSNYTIIGVALTLNLFGPTGLQKGAIALAAIIPLSNVLSVLALTLPTHRENKITPTLLASNILLNPLVIASVAAIIFSAYHWTIPALFVKVGNSLAALAMPLALLAIGGSLHMERLKQDWKIALSATGIKLIVGPLLLTLLAVYLGFRGQDLGIAFLLFATPTAVSSFIMAKAMGNNSRLAGNIVLMTTLGSVVTLAIGIFMLKSFGLI